MLKNRLLILIVMIVVVAMMLGIVIGRYTGYSVTGIEKKPMYWIDTMEPQIHYPGPGKSRMGMELVPVYAEDEQDKKQPGIQVSPAVVNNLGVRIAPVTKGSLARQIETVAFIEPNENKIIHIHAYAEGWVKKLIIKAVGERVKKDQLLLQLYSPMLVNVQEEYLIALESRNQSLINASYKKLQAFHIAPKQIQQLKQTRKANQLIDIYSPQNGIIAELNIREGMHITPTTDIMSIVDLSTVWMIAQVYEDQANWVKVGELADARLSAFPGKIWKGEVEYIYPQLDPTTRTLKVRFRFKNPNNILKPNMYANVSLSVENKPDVLSIPTEALIRTSKGNRVVISLGNGRFDIRSVITGIESGDRVEILSGLKSGEQVVISGQFLIDSESNLKASFERLENPKE